MDEHAFPLTGFLWLGSAVRYICMLAGSLKANCSVMDLVERQLNGLMPFLCYRQQRVVVNGFKSDWAPVVSGVPQGTVLGPLLFSLHINDITSDIESEIRLFADDCVCYREIKNVEDTVNFRRMLID